MSNATPITDDELSRFRDQINSELLSRFIARIEADAESLKTCRETHVDQQALLDAHAERDGALKALSVQRIVSGALLLTMTETPDEKDDHIGRLQREKEVLRDRVRELESR